MADDLIIKFFREDLTEAEETALSDRLSSSVEDALRFGQHAEASYRHYGLPDPRWRGGPPPGGFFPTSGFKWGLGLLVAFLAGLSAWGALKYWKGSGAQAPASIPVVSSTAVDAVGAGQPQASHTGSKKKVIPERLNNLQPEVDASQDTEPPPATGAAVQAPPSALPPSPAAGPGHSSHTNLEVVVKQAKTGPVLVRVLGPDGAQAVMLYQGMLQPGNWAFDWNGRLANGDAPPAGSYRIQIVSGAVTLSKNVNIH